MKPSRLTLPAGTNELLPVHWRVDKDAIDPTIFTAQAQWTAAGAGPADESWEAVSWAPGGPPYRVLVPADKAAGTYRLWVRLIATQETPLRLVSIVTFQ